LIYALGTTVFHFRVVLYSPCSATKKINLPRNEKVGNELRRPLGRWKKVKRGEHHRFHFFFTFNPEINCRRKLSCFFCPIHFHNISVRIILHRSTFSNGTFTIYHTTYYKTYRRYKIQYRTNRANVVQHNCMPDDFSYKITIKA